MTLQLVNLISDNTVYQLLITYSRETEQQTFLEIIKNIFFSWIGLNNDNKCSISCHCLTQLKKKIKLDNRVKIYFVQSFVLSLPKQLCTSSIGKGVLHLYILITIDKRVNCYHDNGNTKIFFPP